MENERKINIIELDKVKSLLLISQQDLECSEILFNNKKYSNSVFSLSQSIEKIAKCMVLMEGLIKFDELKEKVGHHPLKKYRQDVFNNLEKAKRIEEAIQKIPELKELPFIKSLDLKDFKEKAQFAEEMMLSVLNKEKIFSEDINELDGAIKEMNRLIEEVKNLNMEQINKKQFEQYKEAWTNSINTYIKISEEQGIPISSTEKEESLNISDDVFKMIVDNTRKNLLLQGVTHSLNSMLNILISPHFEFLRYPDLKNPLEYYTEQNPLIKRLDKLISIQKENTSLHKELLEILERQYSRIIIEK